MHAITNRTADASANRQQSASLKLPGTPSRLYLTQSLPTVDDDIIATSAALTAPTITNPSFPNPTLRARQDSDLGVLAWDGASITVETSSADQCGRDEQSDMLPVHAIATGAAPNTKSDCNIGPESMHTSESAAEPGLTHAGDHGDVLRNTATAAVSQSDLSPGGGVREMDGRRMLLRSDTAPDVMEGAASLQLFAGIRPTGS